MNPLHILAVDDDPTFCEVLRVIFQGLDALDSCKLTIANDAESAETRLQNERFDAVLLDLRLPDKDGYAVLRHIRATQPTLPVLLLSAIDRADATILGDPATEFGQKPARLTELRELVTKYINRVRTAGP